MPRVRRSHVQHLRRALEREGHRLDGPPGSPPDGFVDERDVARLWLAAAHKVGRRRLPSILARELALGDLGAVGALLSLAPDVRGAVVAASRFGRLFADDGTFRLHEDGVAARVTYHHRDARTLFGALLAEFSLAAAVETIDRLLPDGGLALRAVHFAHEADDDARASAEMLFGPDMEVRFEAPVSALVMDVAELDRRLSSEITYVRAFVEHEAARLLSFVTSTRRDAVADSLAALRAALDRGTRPSEADVAKRLGMSQRSLRRHLALEGTSFRLLLDAETVRQAESHLLAGASVEEAARRVGLSEAGVYYRLHRRVRGRPLRRGRD